MNASELYVALRDRDHSVAPPARLRRILAELVEDDPAAVADAFFPGYDWRNLANAPDSPWFIEDADSLPWLDALPKSVAKRLRSRTLGLVTRQLDGRWYLGYLLIRGPMERWRFDIYVGGPPNPDPVLPPEALAAVYDEHESLRRYAWTVPDALGGWYAVHDGLGGDRACSFDATDILWPSSRLRILRAHDQPEDAFLSVMCDGSGVNFGFFKFFDKIYANAYEWYDAGLAKKGKPGATFGKVLLGGL